MLRFLGLPALVALVGCAETTTPVIDAAAFLQQSCGQLASAHYNSQIRVGDLTGKNYRDAFEASFAASKQAKIDAEETRIKALDAVILSKGCDHPPIYIPAKETSGTAGYWNTL